MKSIILLISLLLGGHAFAQHEAEADTLPLHNPDTLSFFEAFRKGLTTGHFRYFYMATNNAKGLTDYYAHAAGGGLKFETAPFRHFQFGVGGFFIYNLHSSNLAEEDPLTHQGSRYELGLFDLEDPENKNDIDRLEELYLKYTGKNFKVTVGKQLITTPFINPQDSRMRPTEVDGLYGDVSLGKKWRLEGGWLFKISPRSTVEWYSVANSIGINGQGVTQDGRPGDYRHHLSSKGIALAGLSFKPSEQLHLKAYNQFVENIFNTALLQAEYHKPLSSGNLLAALQYIRQDAVNDGGNADLAKTYFDKRNKAAIFGARLGVQQQHWQSTINYTRIGKGGRFTAPREWGTEPLFTYLSRERNEGLGDVHALMANIRGTLPAYHLRLEAGYGHYYLPDADNAFLNKYKLPSYRHVKALADYEFKGTLQGLDIALLWIYKGQLRERKSDPKYLFNKVDMSSFNLIMNYRF